MLRGKCCRMALTPSGWIMLYTSVALSGASQNTDQKCSGTRSGMSTLRSRLHACARSAVPRRGCVCVFPMPAAVEVCGEHARQCGRDKALQQRVAVGQLWGGTLKAVASAFHALRGQVLPRRAHCPPARLTCPCPPHPPPPAPHPRRRPCPPRPAPPAALLQQLRWPWPAGSQGCPGQRQAGRPANSP